MKKKLFVCGISALMFGMTSCKLFQKNTFREGPDVMSEFDIFNSTIGDNSQNALDWAGYYSAILPCDDCGGIQVSLDLLSDGTYKMKKVYFGKEDSNSDSFGDVVWGNSGSTITVGEDIFLVGEDRLIMLEKDRVIEDFSDSPILTKVNSNLIEKYWKLTELFGEAVNTTEGGREAHIIFKKEDFRITGNSGCNTFNGSYALSPGNRINFLRSMSTMMMCSNMDTETKMYQALEMADSYYVSEDKLVLNRARMAPLARFEAVSME